MLKSKIAITSLVTLSPLGDNPAAIWKEYSSPLSCISSKIYDGRDYFVACIPPETRSNIDQFRQEDVKYKALDETVVMAIHTARQAIKKAGWKKGDEFGINIGSSRGATQLFEKITKSFLKQELPLH